MNLTSSLVKSLAFVIPFLYSNKVIHQGWVFLKLIFIVTKKVFFLLLPLRSFSLQNFPLFLLIILPQGGHAYILACHTPVLRQCSTSHIKTQLLFSFWVRYSSVSGLRCSICSWCLSLYPTVCSKCCILIVFLSWVIVGLPGIFFPFYAVLCFLFFPFTCPCC